MLRLIITAVILGLSAYFLAAVLGINARHIPYLQEVMYATIAVGLYINIVSIDTEIFKSNLNSIFKVILLGVPLKIILPGFLLAYLSPSVAPIAYLCATVIAQIDPIAASHSLDYSNISKKSETILRAWSSFDDPITVLFAFYIFLPIILLVDFNFNEYLLKIFRDIITCFVAYSIYKIYDTKFVISRTYKIFVETITVVAIIIYSILSASFLLPAAVGLFIRPFAAEKLTKINSAIFYFSVVVLGLLSANLSLDWNSGLILAVSTFFLAQVIVTVLFLRDSTESKARVMFGHQNGMTAMLLTVAIEVSGSEKTAALLSVTLPAIICIAIFYFASNYILDILIPSSQA